jgi:hypothetical protein
LIQGKVTHWDFLNIRKWRQNARLRNFFLNNLEHFTTVLDSFIPPQTIYRTVESIEPLKELVRGANGGQELEDTFVSRIAKFLSTLKKKGEELTEKAVNR